MLNVMLATFLNECGGKHFCEILEIYVVMMYT